MREIGRHDHVGMLGTHVLVEQALRCWSSDRTILLFLRGRFFESRISEIDLRIAAAAIEADIVECLHTGP